MGNIVANLVFWVLLGVVVWGSSRASQARFRRFLALESRTVTVMLSNLWRADLSSRETGYVISKHELLAAQAVSNFLGKAPGQLPDLVRGLVDALWLRSRTDCRTEVSPPAIEDRRRLSSGSWLVVGSSARNAWRRRYLEDGVPAAVLENERDGSTIRSDDVRSVVIRRSNGDQQVMRTELNVAVLEKVRIDNGAVFFCLGSRADGTWGAAEYLVRNWRALEREFREDPFVVCLGFPRIDPYLEEYVEPTVLAKFRP